MIFAQRRIELEVRRAQLVARSRTLRAQVAQLSGPISKPFAIADRIGAGMGWLLAHPWWLLAAVTVPLVMRPARAIGAATRIWAGWRIWKKTMRLVRSLT
ncbi:YqjK family protein [Caenimonas sp. SL110]|uniref:YqjK family protein n=1 Tax=Caenimonas sp. SL110 TaxID=1450524 RepID=UPI0006534527|nr:YqjK family protein [Caenimonas sp. SL110]